MRAALLIFCGLTAGLLLLVARANKWAALGDALRAQGRVLVPLILLAVLLAACIEVLLSPTLVATWLGQESGLRGVLLGWLAGALTPGGGPIGLPLAAALFRRGASLPVLLTYLTSMSLLSLLRLPMEWGILGTRLTLTRWAATALVPPLIGVISWLLRG